MHIYIRTYPCTYTHTEATAIGKEAYEKMYGDSADGNKTGEERYLQNWHRRQALQVGSTWFMMMFTRLRVLFACGNV